VQHYADLSERGSYLEAINQLYEVLRWAETQQNCDLVLIPNILSIEKAGEASGSRAEMEGFEFREALFDRIYRATSGKIFD